MVDSAQPLSETDISEIKQSVLASCLALLNEKYPALATILAAWPTLPAETREAIMALAEGRR
jgi:hypothetical protein